MGGRLAIPAAEWNRKPWGEGGAGCAAQAAPRRIPHVAIGRVGDGRTCASFFRESVRSVFFVYAHPQVYEVPRKHIQQLGKVVSVRNKNASPPMNRAERSGILALPDTAWPLISISLPPSSLLFTDRLRFYLSLAIEKVFCTPLRHIQ